MECYRPRQTTTTIDRHQRAKQCWPISRTSDKERLRNQGDMPRVRPDHLCCRDATWICVCGHTHDIVIIFQVSSKSVQGLRSPSGCRNLPNFPVTCTLQQLVQAVTAVITHADRPSHYLLFTVSDDPLLEISNGNSLRLSTCTSSLTIMTH